MKKFPTLLAAVLLVSSLLAAPASAAGSSAPETPQGDGYILQLRPDAALPDGAALEACYAPQGLYTAQYPAQVLELLGTQAVEYFEPNYRVALQGRVSDPYYSQQWNLRALDAEQVWNAPVSASGIRVALIDSGLSLTHEDLQGMDILVEDGVNLLTGSHDLTDKTGHGTFIAGVLAAARNNGKGIAGMIDGITIVPLKCFGEEIDTSIAYIVAAIYKAVDHYHCGIINLSLGLQTDAKSLREAVAYADSKNVLLISSTGNTGTERLLYPAAYDCVIGVGSVGRDGQVSDFSERNKSVFITAPGEDILGLSMAGDREYKQGSGTSFAAPHVTALAAVARGYDPEITADKFRLLLAASAYPCSGSASEYGCGIVNAGRFVDYLTSGTPSAADFPDLDGHWARVEAERGLRRSLFHGVSDTAFAPDARMTRAMLVQLLYNLEGNPVTGAAGFSDVPKTAWYHDAVAWAVAHSLVTGTEDRRFLPDDAVTREQLAVILWRYARYKQADVSQSAPLDGFADAAAVSAYARTALEWAGAAGVIGGVSATQLDPQGAATRAQAATVFNRLLPILEGQTPQQAFAAAAAR